MVDQPPDRGRNEDLIPDRDIIAAAATPPGRGAVAMVRASGSGLDALISPLVGRQRLDPRHAHYLSFLDDQGQVIDRGLIVFFPAPHSYTGEDMLELSCHGSPVIVELLLKRLYQLGARPAQPGEFSQRAFLNGKLDLAQVEAVASLIECSSEQAARAAQRSLEGVFSQDVHALGASLNTIRVQVEAAIDFSDENIDLLGRHQVLAALQALIGDLRRLQARARQGRLLQEGMTVVIAGPPNAGKSSLLNALAQRETAIVTDIAGTTRDVIREHVLIDGMPLHVIDTAGLREGGDQIEREGMRRAREAMQKADRILLVQDATANLGEGRGVSGLPESIPVTKVLNKIDLHGVPPRLEETGGIPAIHLSAKTGAGLELLRSHLKRIMGFEAEAEDTVSARRRHLEALTQVREYLEWSLQELEQGQAVELAAENLRLAQRHLGEITGEVSSEDLLGEIFSEFCIGK